MAPLLAQSLGDEAVRLIRAGGWVMYPLLALSLLSLSLTVERALFWLSTHGAAESRRVEGVLALARRRDYKGAAAAGARDPSIYGRYLADLLAEAAGGAVSPAFAQERAEALRPRLERFATTHAVIITAAPMLGILGTVTGIIGSFKLLGADQSVNDPTVVAAGIAEALLTTALGLIVALTTIFPHAVFRAQADRALSRLEMLAAAAIEATNADARPAAPASPAAREPSAREPGSLEPGAKDTPARGRGLRDAAPHDAAAASPPSGGRPRGEARA